MAMTTEEEGMTASVSAKTLVPENARPVDIDLPEEKAHKPVSQWMLVWRRLRRHKLALAGFGVFLIIALFSLLASWVAPYPYDEQEWSLLYTPWFTAGVVDRPVHWMGTDGLGRDTLTRVLYAGRISLGVALTVTLITTLFGAVLGAVSGYLGGATDSLLMRFTDLMYSLPDLPLLIILSFSLRQFVGLQNLLGSWLSVAIIIFVLSFFGWMTNARLVRGSVLSLREQEFIEASRALGASKKRLVFQHLIPNSLAPIIVAATLSFGAIIIAESALSFLGFGVMPPVPTWGNMLNEARGAPQIGYTLFYQTLAPGLFIFLTVLAVNFIGDGLRDALDPRLKL
jgi:peptide/nickel transport system permease protein